LRACKSPVSSAPIFRLCHDSLRKPLLGVATELRGHNRTTSSYCRWASGL
jgi:hypothetical protein